MDRRSGWALIVCAAVSALPMGCAQAPRPLSAELFAPPVLDAPHRPGDLAVDSSLPVDQSSPTKAIILTPLQPHSLGSITPLEELDAAAKDDNATKVDSDPTSAAQPASASLSPAQDAAQISLQASPAPVPGASIGVYMTVGSMLAKVNGTPIYSGQVLRRLDKELTAKARDMDEADFRDFARNEIARQLDELIQDEVIFDLALNELDEKDRDFAQMITINIKQEKITAAGGSLEAAKRRSAADGENFDDAMTRTYREIVHSLVERKVIEPMVKIGQDDLYKFYKQNVNKLYSQKSKALFRVIQIDPAAMKDSDPKRAENLATTIRGKAVHGQDFALLATIDNTDTYLRSHGGDPGGWMEPDTYRVEAVEKAVWQLNPGEVTPVIESNGVYYVAKLSDKQIGITRPFSDSDVQADIYNRLRQQQISERWQLAKQQPDISPDIIASDNRLETAVDLAVQKFKPKS